MLISGFSMVRNATKLYYPVKASIESILPIVDEFVIALGDCDADDRTLEEIQSISSNKIKIIRTKWDMETYANGAEYAHQTDIAKEHCKGDWLFYLQSDEVVHEKYLSVIKKKCEELLSNKKVEGLLFNYKHFWGDYIHYIVSHAWYANEVRIIRNDPEIHSWRDAQSFRRIPGFNGKDFFQKKNTSKLHVTKVPADIYHYGWVRPPQLMQKKRISFENHMGNTEKATSILLNDSSEFNYGKLSRLKNFQGTHPEVMNDFIKRMNWQLELYPYNKKLKKHKHDKLKNRLISLIEEYLLNGQQIATFKNYKLIKP